MKTWFDNLKVWQKLTLVSVFFMMLDAVILYHYIAGINEHIHTAQLEKMGNTFQRPLEDLLELIPQYGALTRRVAHGQKSAWAPMVKSQEQIEAVLQSLESVNEKIGARLQFTDTGLAKRKREHYSVRTLRREWKSVKNGAVRPDAITDRLQHLLGDVRMMISHGGDMSNLVTDHELDSTYLVDVTLWALPAAQQRLAEIIAYGEDVLKGQPLSHLDQAQFAVYGAMLKDADLDRISRSLNTALEEHKHTRSASASLHARLLPTFAEYVSAADAFIQLTNGFSRSAAVVYPEVYQAAGTLAQAASFRLWKIAAAELDALLQQRIDYYARERARGFLIGALALLGAIGLVSFIARSISGPLKRQAAELNAANESLQAEISGHHRTEKELRRRKGQLALAQQITCTGSWALDVRSRHLVWSTQHYRTHGVEPDKFELSYESMLAFIHPDEREFFVKTMEWVAVEGKSFSFEQRIIRSDGCERILYQRGNVVCDSDNGAVEICGTAQDVTEQKQTERGDPEDPRVGKKSPAARNVHHRDDGQRGAGRSGALPASRHERLYQQAHRSG